MSDGKKENNGETFPRLAIHTTEAYEGQTDQSGDAQAAAQEACSDEEIVRLATRIATDPHSLDVFLASLSEALITTGRFQRDAAAARSFVVDQQTGGLCKVAGAPAGTAIAEPFGNHRSRLVRAILRGLAILLRSLRRG